jgi:hypothetical protein
MSDDKNGNGGLLAFLHTLSQPKQESPEKKKLRERLRRHMNALIPEVKDNVDEDGDDAQPLGFATALRVANRERLVECLTNSMAGESSAGFVFKYQMEPEWKRVLLQNKFKLYGRRDKSAKTHIYFPDTNQSLIRQRTLRKQDKYEALVEDNGQ